MRKQKKPNHALIWFAKITGGLGTLIFLKPKVYYEDKKVQGRRLKGACVLMSNHKSLLDFLLYELLFFRRDIRFLMAEVLFNKGKLFSWLLFGMGGIYVNRDSRDFGFLGECIDTLEKGQVVGFFPESRLPVKGEVHHFVPSISILATHTDAPVIPVYTDGRYGLFKRTSVMIGTPVHVQEYINTDNPSEAEIKQLTQILEDKVNALGEELEKRKNNGR